VSYLAGLTMANNTTDPTNDIDIAPGAATASGVTTLMSLLATTTKRLDATWAAGSGNGMRMNAAIADGWYHIFMVAQTDGASPDYFAHTSPDAATALTALQSINASYLYARRIGSILRAAGTIVPFFQIGDCFRWASIRRDVEVANPGTTGQVRTVSVPAGVRVLGMFHARLNCDSSLGFSFLITDPSAPDLVPDPIGLFGGQLSAEVGAQQAAGQLICLTGTASNVRTRIDASNANSMIRIFTEGWVDYRGR
jgi:hypothetical protein